MIFSRQQLLTLAIIAGLIVMAAVIMVWHHVHITARLQEAENRLNWLEPVPPFLGIEQKNPPNQQGEYNPAEFKLIADEREYYRAYYSPEVNTTTALQPDWCYVPRLSQINQHRLFLFTGGGSFFADLWGILRLNQLPDNWYDRDFVYLLVINAQVKDVFWQGDQLMTVVTPSLKGYQVIKVTNLADKPPTAWLLDSNYQVWEQAYR